MKPTPDPDQLLKEILNENGYAEFRAGLYQRCSVELRRRRQARRRNQLLALAACVALSFSLFSVYQTALRTPEKSQSQPPDSNPFVVHTSPLLPDQLVAPNAAPVELVRTDFVETPVALVSDDELLALFEGRSAALVTTGLESKRLLFLNPADQIRFFGQESGERRVNSP